MPMKTTLHQVINRITERSLPDSVRKKSFIVNDVEDQLLIPADENKVASILSGIICLVIDNTDNGCIRISAQKTQDAVVVSVKETGITRNKMIIQQIERLCLLAEKMGAWIGFGENEPKTINIRFPQLQTAA